MMKVLFLPVLLFLLTSCEKAAEQQPGNMAEKNKAVAQTVAPRWYTREQVERGYQIFQTHCAVCHKPDASGTENWQELDANGKLPPPPLNGTAHTWHHSMAVLHRAVREGGIPLGGSMPPFKDKLNQKDINDILAWVMSHWSDRVYGIWYERQKKSGKKS